MHSGDIAWGAIVGSAVIYELNNDDLLSMAMDRYRDRHPIFTRLAIMAIAGHFAGALPPALDIFSAHNVIHRALVHLRDR